MHKIRWTTTKTSCVFITSDKAKKYFTSTSLTEGRNFSMNQDEPRQANKINTPESSTTTQPVASSSRGRSSRVPVVSTVIFNQSLTKIPVPEMNNNSGENPWKLPVNQSQNSGKGKTAPEVVNKPVYSKTRIVNKNRSKGTENSALKLEAVIDAVATGKNVPSTSKAGPAVVAKTLGGGAPLRPNSRATVKTKKTMAETVSRRAQSPDIVDFQPRAKRAKRPLGNGSGEMIEIVGNNSIQSNPSSSGGNGNCLSSNDESLVIIDEDNVQGGQSSAEASLKAVTEDLEILLTFESCSCLLCHKKLEIDEGIVLKECHCTFCRGCLITIVEKSSAVQISCPRECGGRMLESEIKAIVTPETYERYQIKAMMPNLYFCRTKDCRGCCEYESDSKIFLCMDCNKSNCLSCKAIHEGLECKEFQDLLATAIRDGKSKEDAEELIHSQLANGWEQMLGNVSGWVGSSPMNNLSQNYSNILQKMADLDIWLSTREFECPVCVSIIPVGNGIILQDCLHTVCRECAIGLVEYATEPEVKCPFQDGNYSCTSHLKPREIKALVSPELHETYLSRSMKQAEGSIPNSFHCKTPDCPGWCVVEAGALDFVCEVCSKRNCLICKVIHENVTCADYKNKLVQNTNNEASKKMLEELIAKGECMLCPTCKIVVDKDAGCDWVVCSVCKTEICWATKGPRWGPKGNGDITGGCKCKVGNKLCAPNCKNCH